MEYDQNHLVPVVGIGKEPQLRQLELKPSPRSLTPDTEVVVGVHSGQEGVHMWPFHLLRTCPPLTVPSHMI